MAMQSPLYRCAALAKSCEPSRLLLTPSLRYPHQRSSAASAPSTSQSAHSGWPCVRRRACRARAAIKDQGTEAVAAGEPTAGAEGASSSPACDGGGGSGSGTGPLAALLAVSLLWGTYTPSLRFLLQDAAASPQSITACRALISASTLIVASGASTAWVAYSRRDAGATHPEQQQGISSSGGSGLPGGVALLPVLLAGAELGCYNFCGTAVQAMGVGLTSATKAAFLGQVTAVLTPTLAWLAGQPVAPLHWAACVAALVGSVLIALDSLAPMAAAPQPAAANGGGDASGSTCEVPLGGELATAAPPSADALIGAAITDGNSSPLLAADAIAHAGGGALCGPGVLAHPAGWAAVPPPLPADGAWGGHGELYVLGACFFYALATVRLSHHAPRFKPVQLATAKTVVLAAASISWLLISNSSGNGGSAGDAAAVAATATSGGVPSWLHLPDMLTHGPGALLLVYSAVGPGALATFLSARGQSAVPAAEAQVLYSLTPVWAALFAAATLSGEEMGGGGWAGAAVILVATLVVAVADTSSRAAAGPASKERPVK